MTAFDKEKAAGKQVNLPVTNFAPETLSAGKGFALIRR